MNNDTHAMLEKLRAGDALPVGELGELRLVRKPAVRRKPFEIFMTETIEFHPRDEVRALFMKFDFKRS